MKHRRWQLIFSVGLKVASVTLYLFHLEEEITRRLDVHDLSDQDEAHIKSDIETAYIALLVQWIDYMGYLQRAYPNLFMFAIATNPLTTRPSNRESSQD